jgi:hypothetical protein
VRQGGEPAVALGVFSVVFGKGVFVVDGGWVSSDGLHFAAAPGATGDEVVFSHGRFLSTGREGSPLAVSDDGRSWSTPTSSVATDDRTLSCADHTCIALGDGVLVVPAPTDPAPLPRLQAVQVNQKDSGPIAVKVNQRIHVFLDSLTEGRYGTAALSSPAVRYLYDGVIAKPPSPPVRGSQYFFFAGAAPGQAELRIPHSGPTPEFRVSFDVTAR